MCVIAAHGVQFLVAGCQGSGAGQQAMRPGRGGNNTHTHSLELLMMGIEVPETC